MYAAWSTSTATAAKAEVPLWQIAVTALTICIGFITYGYNIMKGKFEGFHHIINLSLRKR